MLASPQTPCVLSIGRKLGHTATGFPQPARNKELSCCLGFDLRETQLGPGPGHLSAESRSSVYSGMMPCENSKA